MYIDREYKTPWISVIADLLVPAWRRVEMEEEAESSEDHTPLIQQTAKKVKVKKLRGNFHDAKLYYYIIQCRIKQSWKWVYYVIVRHCLGGFYVI